MGILLGPLRLWCGVPEGTFRLVAGGGGCCPRLCTSHSTSAHAPFQQGAWACQQAASVWGLGALWCLGVWVVLSPSPSSLCWALSESRSVMSDSLRPHGRYSPGNSPGQNPAVGILSLLQGNLPNPEIESRSPALQVDSLPAETLGKPKTTGVGSLSLLQGIVPTQESNQGLRNCRWILYQLRHQGIPTGQLINRETRCWGKE